MANISTINSNPIVTNGERKQMLQQCYFTTTVVYPEASGSDLLLYWTGDLAFRYGGQGFWSGGWSLTNMLSALGDDYKGEDSAGRTCLKIPNAYTLCLDLEDSSQRYKMIARENVNYDRYVPVLAVIAGRAVGGILMSDYLRVTAGNDNKSLSDRVTRLYRRNYAVAYFYGTTRHPVQFSTSASVNITVTFVAGETLTIKDVNDTTFITKTFTESDNVYDVNAGAELYINLDGTIDISTGAVSNEERYLLLSNRNGICTGGMLQPYWDEQLYMKGVEAQYLYGYFTDLAAPTFEFGSSTLTVTFPAKTMRVYGRVGKLGIYEKSFAGLSNDERTFTIPLNSYLILDTSDGTVSVVPAATISGSAYNYVEPAQHGRQYVLLSYDGSFVGGILSSYASAQIRSMVNGTLRKDYVFSESQLTTGSLQGSGAIAYYTINVTSDWIEVFPNDTITFLNPSDLGVRVLGGTEVGKPARLLHVGYSYIKTLKIPSDINAIRIAYSYTERMGTTAARWQDGYVDGELGVNIMRISANNVSGLKDNGIVSLNSDVSAKLHQARRRLNVGANGYQSLPNILTLLHFSDIHGHSDNLKRIMDFKNEYASMLDDAICTGDIMPGWFGNNFDFWDARTDGTVLTCIGNHDSLNNSSFVWTDTVSQEDLYDRFIGPYAEAWGNDAHTTEGNTYYYKDYPSSMMRLIVLDTTIRDTTEMAAQVAWLSNTLDAAKSSGYAVVCAEHFPAMNATKIPCTFTSVTRSIGNVEMSGYAWGTAYDDLQDAVQDFIDAGGEFTCWLCGHTHTDFIVYNPNYPRQTFVTVTTAQVEAIYEDAARIVGDKSQDAFNLVSFDTASHMVKIIRVGQDRDCYLRHLGTLTLNYSTSPATVVYND